MIEERKKFISIVVFREGDVINCYIFSVGRVTNIFKYYLYKIMYVTMYSNRIY